MDFLRRTGTWVFVVAIAFGGIMLATSGAHGLTGFPLDDAWIHMVYGRSIASGGYLAYNEGTPATGATSPLWAYALGFIHIIFRTTNIVVLAAKVLGILFHGLMAWATYRILRRWIDNELVPVAGGAIIGLSPALVSASMSGMEIPLGCALCLLAFERYQIGKFLASGVLLGLAGLTRPEYGLAALVVIGSASYELSKGKSRVNEFIRLAGPVLVTGALFIGWNLWVDGRPLPATFYIKSGFSRDFPVLERIRVGFRMISADAPLVGGVAWLGLVGFAFLRPPARKNAFLLVLTGFLYVICQTLIIAPADPEAFYHIRYLLPAVPLLWTGLLAGLWAGLTFLRQRIGRTGNEAQGKGLARFFGGTFAVAMVFFLILGNMAWRSKFVNDCRNINEVQVRLGKDLHLAFPQSSKVGTVDAGAVKYFGNKFTIDLVGLNTPNTQQPGGPSLDALVLMPAWVVLPRNHFLTQVDTRRTLDYQVTSNPRMDTQVIMVGQGGPGPREMPILLLGKKVMLSLICLTDEQIEDIKKAISDN